MPDRSEVDWDKTDKSKFLLYGGLFTVGVDFILYPLELLKTRVQVEAKSRATLFEASVSAYRGVLQQNGVRGLWGGFPLYTIGGLPSQGAYFYGYQWAVTRCTAWNSSRSENSRLPLFMIDMAAGFFADVVAAPLWTPTEVVASRLQIQGPGVVKYDGALHAFRHILATEGFPGFFRGISVSILAFGPASALWWAMYQSCNRNLTAVYHPTDTNGSGIETTGAGHVWIEALSGLVAGTVSSVVTNPLDIAKTRLQTQHVLLQDFDLMDSADKKEDSKKGTLTKIFNTPRQNALLKAPLRMTASAASAAAAHLKKPGKVADPTKTIVSLPVLSPVPSTASGTALSSSHTLLLPSVGGGGVPFRASIVADINAVEMAAAETRERVEAAARDDARRAAARGTMAPHGGGGGVSSGGIIVSTGSGHLSTSTRLSTQLAASVKPTSSGSRGSMKDASRSRFPRSTDQSRLRSSFQSPSTSNASKARLQTGLFSVLSDIYRRDGARALLRGLLPRMLMQGPASAATFVCFEQVKRLSKIHDS
jgi:hypothetical protein